MATDALKIALILTAVDKFSDVFDKSITKAQKRIKAISHMGGKMMLAGSAGIEFFDQAINAAEENEVAVRRLEQVYKSMGQNVEQASRQSQDFAQKLEFQIGVTDEEIMAIQSKLAAFKRVSDETARMAGIMDRATAAAFDLGANGFGDAASNAIKLGKLLNFPVKNINALSRAGIQFSKQEQDRIKILIRSNKITDAQALILKSVEKRAKGVGASMLTQGQLAKIKYGELQEEIGKKLLPTWNAFLSKVNDIVPKIMAFVQAHGQLIKILAGVSVALYVVGAALKFIAVIAAANPVVLIITAIAAAIAAAAMLIYTYWDDIVDYFANLWEAVKQIFSVTWKWIKKIFWDNNPIVLIYKNWGKIVQWFHDLWEKVKAKFWNFIHWLTALPGKFLDKGIAIINSIWEGMKIAWPAVESWFKSVLVGLYAPGEAEKIRVEGIINSAKKYNEYQQRLNGNAPAGKTTNGVKSLSPASYNSTSRRSTSMILQPTINLHGGATAQDAAMINTNLKKLVKQAMSDINNNNERTAYS